MAFGGLFDLIKMLDAEALLDTEQCTWPRHLPTEEIYGLNQRSLEVPGDTFYNTERHCVLCLFFTVPGHRSCNQCFVIFWTIYFSYHQSIYTYLANPPFLQPSSGQQAYSNTGRITVLCLEIIIFNHFRSFNFFFIPSVSMFTDNLVLLKLSSRL